QADRLEQPAQRRRPGAELQAVGDARAARLEVLVADRRGPALEEGRLVDQLHGGDLRAIEGDVDGLEREPAERAAPDADAGRAQPRAREAVVEVGLGEERVPV